MGRTGAECSAFVHFILEVDLASITIIRYFVNYYYFTLTYNCHCGYST